MYTVLDAACDGVSEDWQEDIETADEELTVEALTHYSTGTARLVSLDADNQ